MFILVAVFIWSGMPVISMQEFSSKETCEAAMVYIKDAYHITNPMVCLKK
jgi:hypothetical protein